MLKEEKIRLMTKLARYESGEGKEKNCGLPGIIAVIISVWHCFAIFSWQVSDIW